MPRFDMDAYDTVADRLKRFWADHPTGRIATSITHAGDDLKTVIVKAAVYADIKDEHPAATGYAQEMAGGAGANATSWVENAETSAIGRALANWTYSGDKRPSREEMAKASRTPEQPPARGNYAQRY